MQLGDFSTHLHAQLGVQVGQRFVHQEDLGFTHDGAAQSNTLALTAGQSLGLTVEQVGDVQNAGGFFHAALDFVLGGLAQLQAESHVVINRHMGIQSVVLEHHGDIAILGSNIVHQLVADVQFAVADFFQTGNHAQGGGLTAARGADQNDKFLIFNFQVEIAYGGDATGIDLVDVLQRYAAHE